MFAIVCVLMGSPNLLPLQSRLGWELVQWAKLHRPGSITFSDLLAIESVRRHTDLYLDTVAYTFNW